MSSPDGSGVGWLRGRRVVITRAAEQQGPLAGLLAKRGALPIELALIRTVIDDDAVAELASMSWDGVRWLVVTSPAAAACVNSGPLPDTVRIAAVGPTTAARLGGQVAVPPRHNGAGLVDWFEPCVDDGRIVVVQSAAAATTVVDGLSAKGWRVDVVRPYDTRPVESVAADVAAAALDADALVLMSGSAARAWVAHIGMRTPPVVVALGPQTAADSTEIGLKVTVVAADHSLHGLVTSLDTFDSCSD